MNGSNLSAAEKLDAFTILKKELNDKIYEIFGGTPPGKAAVDSPNATGVFDFHSDEFGVGLLKVHQDKTISDFDVNPDQISTLKEKFFPDRFKFDKVMQMLSDYNKPPPI